MKNRSRIFLVAAALALFLSSGSLWAQSQLITNPANLSQFPSVEQIRNATKGTDDVDSHARFIAALWRINDMMIRDLVTYPNGGKEDFPPAAASVQGQYRRALSRYGIDEVPPEARDPRFRPLETKYGADPAFLDFLLVQLFSPRFRTDYYAWVRKPVPPQTASTAEQKPGTTSTNAALRFDGFYFHDEPADGTRHWLRFYEDGSVVGATVGKGGGTPKEIAVWLKKGYSTNGRYAKQGSNVGFSLMFKTAKGEDGQTNYSGTIGNGSLRLNWNSLVNGNSGVDDYRFMQWPDAGSGKPAVVRQSSNETVSPEAIAQYEKGKQFFKAGDYPKAVTELEKAIAMNLDMDRLLAAYIALGYSYNYTGQYAKTIAVMPKAIAVKKLAVLYHILGNAYERTLQFPKALAALREAVRLEPKEAVYLSSLGSNLILNGRAAEAKEVYNTLLKVDEKEAGYLLDEINNKRGPVGVLVKRAQLGLIGRDTAEALEWFRNALRLRPTDIDTLMDIGSGLDICGKYDEALAVYRRAMTLKPTPEKLGTLHYFIGQTYNNLKNYPKALTELIEANRLNPGYYSKHEIGKTYFETQQFPKALTAFQEAIKFNPKEADGHIMLGRTFAAMGQVDDAVAALKELVTLDPKSGRAWMELGRINFEAKRYPDAGRAFSSALRINPKDTAALFGIGKTYLAVGRKPDAMKAYTALKPLDEKLAQQLLDEINKR